MNQFKFFRGFKSMEDMFNVPVDPSHYGEIDAPTPRDIPYEEYQGWAAHYNNIPPGQCPYDIGTIERADWMTGWGKREDAVEPNLYDQDFIDVEDVDTGEIISIPITMSYAISYRGRMLYDNSRTVSGRCEHGGYEYWIDNVYSTLENTLVISVTISVPNTIGRGVTFHKIRQII